MSGRRSRFPWNRGGGRERQQAAPEPAPEVEARWTPGLVFDGGQADPYGGPAIYDEDGSYIGQELTEQQVRDAHDEAVAEAFWTHDQGGGWPPGFRPSDYLEPDPADPEPGPPEPEAEP